MEITLEQFTKTSEKSGRRSNTNAIIQKIIAALKNAKVGVRLTAPELYNKKTAHYYGLFRLMNNQAELKSVIKSFAFNRVDGYHFDFVDILKK